MAYCSQRIMLFMLLFVGLTALTVLEAEAQDRRTHIVEPGETLFSISREYAVDVADLRAWNELDSNALRAGMRLFVDPPEALENTVSGQLIQENEASEATPDSSVQSAGLLATNLEIAPRVPGAVRVLDETYSGVIVGEGETLYSLAIRFAIPPDSLWELNSDLPLSIPAGAEIVVPSNRTISRYTVRGGDTLFGIARAQGVSVDAILKANTLTSSSLRIGQSLKIPSSVVGFTDEGRLPEAGVFPAVVYPHDMNERMLVSGRFYNDADYIVSHPSLPMGSIVLVSAQAGDHHVFATVADRSMDSSLGMIELSDAVAEALGRPAPGSRISIHLID